MQPKRGANLFATWIAVPYIQRQNLPRRRRGDPCGRPYAHPGLELIQRKRPGCPGTHPVYLPAVPHVLRQEPKSLGGGVGDGKRGPAASPAKRVAAGEEEDSPRGGEMSAKPTERGRGDEANEPCRLRSGRDALSKRAGGAFVAKAGSKLVCDLVRLCKKSPTGVFSFLHRRGAFFLFDKAEKKEWGSQKRRALDQYERMELSA